MSDVGTATVAGGQSTDDVRGTAGPPPRRIAVEGGFLGRYKPEQGKWTRLGTFVCLLALVAWGGYFLYERLDVFSGDQWWHPVVTFGLPLAIAVVLGGAAWWVTYTNQRSGDFMIATEGEMKKVNWSTRREVIGSTKVVIVFMLLLAAILFCVDFLFQQLFTWIGMLKV